MASAVRIGVVIPTFGDRTVWEPLAQRAFASVQQQSISIPCLPFHGKTLQLARNNGAAALLLWHEVDWLIFLDADDELDPHYLAAMAALANEKDRKGPAIYRPATLGVHSDGHEDDAPVMIERRDLRKSNFIVIGAMCPVESFFKVGGFRDLPILEDWDLWRRLVKSGLSVYDVPEAIYRVHVRDQSRNTNHALHSETYLRILRESPL